jgi:hypothetical protein
MSWLKNYLTHMFMGGAVVRTCAFHLSNPGYDSRCGLHHLCEKSQSTLYSENPGTLVSSQGNVDRMGWDESKL